MTLSLLACCCSCLYCDCDRTPIDYASVSDKIWPHFASRGIQRIPFHVLLNKGLITNVCVLITDLFSVSSSCLFDHNYRFVLEMRLLAFTRAKLICPHSHAVNQL